MTAILLIVIAVLLVLIIFLIMKINELNKKFGQMEFDYRSMHVKHGKNWENFVPFMKEFLGNKENFRFIGNPIDGIIFDDDEIKFVEVKTGTSNLNEKQKKIRDLINWGKVKWRELRYGKG